MALRSTGTSIDASEIIPGLWQGARLAELPINMDVVVFAARELQPDFAHQDHLLIYAPLDDTIYPTPEEISVAERAGARVADLLRRGRRVLVTCNEGRNRSGLITGYALLALGHAPQDAVALIQAHRPGALSNRAFVNLLLGSGVR